MAEYRLSPFGSVSMSLFNRAFDLHDDDREESERLCRLLLGYPQLGDYPKAGCHYLLAHGTENVVWHAERAVYLYENLYVRRPGGSFSGLYPPSPAVLEMQRELVTLAKNIQRKVLLSHRKIEADFKAQMDRFRAANGREPTDFELVEADLRKNGLKDISIEDPDEIASADDEPMETEEEDDSDPNEDIPDLVPRLTPEEDQQMEPRLGSRPGLTGHATPPESSSPSKKIVE